MMGREQMIFDQEFNNRFYSGGLRERFMNLTVYMKDDMSDKQKLEFANKLLEDFDKLIKDVRDVFGDNYPDSLKQIFICRGGVDKVRQEVVQNLGAILPVENEEDASASEQEKKTISIREEFRKEEPVAVENIEEKKEKAKKVKAELRENGDKILILVDSLFNREDIPAGNRDYESRVAGLARLRVDIRERLQYIKNILTNEVDQVEKSVEEIALNGGSFSHGAEKGLVEMYSLVESNIEGVLGEEILKLNPLLGERVRIVNNLFEMNKGLGKMSFVHPRQGEYFDEGKMRQAGSGESSEEVVRAGVKSVVLPGIAVVKRGEIPYERAGIIISYGS